MRSVRALLPFLLLLGGGCASRQQEMLREAENGFGKPTVARNLLGPPNVRDAYNPTGKPTLWFYIPIDGSNPFD